MTGFERGDLVEAPFMGTTMRGRLLAVDWDSFPATAIIHTMHHGKALVRMSALSKVLPPPVTRKEKP